MVAGFCDVIKNSVYLHLSTLLSLVHWLFAFVLVNKFHDDDDSDGGKGCTISISIFGARTWLTDCKLGHNSLKVMFS